MLEKYQMAPDKADIGRELRVLRCLLLLIQLTGRSQPALLKTYLPSTCARGLYHRGSGFFALQSGMDVPIQGVCKSSDREQLILSSPDPSTRAFRASAQDSGVMQWCSMKQGLA